MVNQNSDYLIDNANYNELLQQAVAVIETARTNVARTVATTVSNTYWEIGRLLYERKIDSKHGSSVVKKLSVDLKERFPYMGTSPRQLWNMKAFFMRYKDSDAKVLRCVALLPWKHTLLLQSKDLDDDAVLYYAQEDIAKGWNADLLLNAIKLEMHKTHTSLVVDNNFANTLPESQAQYANKILHSSYNLGFLGVTEPILEAELEHRLVEKIKLFLLELGKGFTYIGNQYPIEYKGSNGIVDLLFFHRGLRCLIAIELKAGKYRPEYAGKMNYYLSILDRTERGEGENPSIGIILCAEKNHVDVELSLDGMDKPIGVADYRLVIPQEELKQIVQNEIQAYDNEKQNEKEE